MENERCLHIQILGGFSLCYQGRTLTEGDNRSKKLWAFLRYLLAHRERSVSQEELVALLWAGEENPNADGTMKALLHRARGLLEQLDFPGCRESIVCRRGFYRWAPSIPCRVDADEFLALSRAALQTAPCQPDLAQAALRLYGGELLPTAGDWVQPVREFYRQQHQRLLSALLPFLLQEGRCAEAEEMSRLALKADPLNETEWVSLVQALLSQDRQQEALAQYHIAADAFLQQGRPIPLQLEGLLQQWDSAMIFAALRQPEETEGPLYCDYALFRQLCRREKRGALLVYLRLAEEVALEQALSALLREEDAYTRLKAGEYLLLLPGLSAEGGEKLRRRLENALCKVKCYDSEALLWEMAVL